MKSKEFKRRVLINQMAILENQKLILNSINPQIEVKTGEGPDPDKEEK